MTDSTEIRNIVIGTAGHIDHGKSTLVQALTGIDPDRWKEEKERGVTIDLGFANFVYQDKWRVGLVDVPGHEKFVKNMVAGASGIDIVILVVAADDGVMPQTREHLEILTLMGVHRGLVALNKADKVDEDTVELAKEDVSDLVTGTFLDGAPVVPISALKREGMDDLWAAIDAAIEATEPRDITGVFRMPVQRVFSAQGHGAVLTGIPLTGQASVGDTLMVLPGEQKAKVRGIQAYHSAIETATAGHSSAFNLAGVDHTKVQRGHTVCTGGVFESSQYFSVELSLLENAAGPVKHRREIKFHVGTSEIVAEVHFMDRVILQPGETAICQVKLVDPVVAGIGDRFIVRRPSPAVTLGGGRVICREAGYAQRNDSTTMQRLETLRTGLDEPLARVDSAIQASGADGIDRDSLIKHTELKRSAIDEFATKLLADGTVTEFGPSRALIHKDAWPRARETMREVLAKFHSENPAQMGMKSASLQQRMGVGPKVFQPILDQALAVNEVERRGELIGLPGEGGKLSDEERKVTDRIGAQLEGALLNPPTLKELGSAAGVNQEATQAAIDYLVGSGRAKVLHGGVLFSTKALDFARSEAVKFLESKGEAAAKDFKEILPTSRKFLIPLLEWLDAEGVTKNVNGIRTLA